METEAAMRQRHKQEQKQLLEKTTKMKKGTAKSARKQVNKQIQVLEEELNARHRDELAQFDEEEEDMSPADLLAQLELTQGSQEEPKKESESADSPADKPKRNRQKERLAKRQAEFDRIQQEATQDQEGQINYRQIELDGLAQQCSDLKLEQVDIKSDGHCLFNSISDQLKHRHDVALDYLQLRKLAGEYISNNKDDFIPFLFNEETGDLQDIDVYVSEISETAKWGSDLEILALARHLDCPISVLQHSQPVHRINDTGSKPELKLVYYKHIFGLGEHYGSLRDSL